MRSRVPIWALAALGVVLAGTTTILLVRGGSQSSGTGHNVILISIDTLRADRLGCYGSASSRTPEIDRLAGEGVRFANATSSCPLTLPSHSTMLTGCYPFVHGARDNGDFRLHPNNVSIAERLRDAGFATAASVGAFVLNREFGANQGFDVYEDVRGGDAGAMGGEGSDSELRADQVCDRALRMLRDNAQRRFFLFVHFFDPHFPYDPPAPYATQFPDRYLGEIAFVDSQIARIRAELTRLGLDRKTLVVLTSDHGEGLGEHDEDTHGVYLYNATLHVPLILWAPGRLPAGKVVDAPVRLVDVAPTILDFLREPPLQTAQGRSLLPAARGGRLASAPAYAESLQGMHNFGFSPIRALREDGWKYIHAPKAQLYNLAEDPNELRNLAAEQPERVQAMRDALRRIVETTPAIEGVAGGRVALSDESVRRLQTLGYAGGSGAASSLGRSELDLLELTPVDPHDHTQTVRGVSRAMLFMHQSRFGECETLLRDLLSRSATPESMHWVSKNLAMALSRQGKHAEAVEFYRRAIDRRPDDGATLTDFATSLAELGRMDEAFAAFLTALEIQPVFARTHLNYAVALARAGRFDEAIVQGKKAVELQPGDTSTLLTLARIQSLAGRLPDAVATLEAAHKQREDDAALRLGLVDFLVEARRFADARRHVETLLARAPRHPQLLARLGEVLLREGQLDAAAEKLRAAIDAEPRFGPARHLLSSVYVAQKKYAEAVEALRPMAAGDAPNVLAANDLAWLLATVPDDRVRNGAEAVRLAEAASRGAGGANPRMLDTLAAAQAEAGRFDDALRTVDAALAIAAKAGDNAFVEELRNRRARYEARQAWRME